MRVLVALAVLVAPLALGVAADASCAPPEPATQRVARADAVVWGSVTGGGGPLGEGRALMVSVRTVYKGSVPDRILVRVGPEITGQGPGQVGATSVDYVAAAGTSHTFYLKQHAPGGFSTDACSGSHEGEPTTEELAVLGTPRRPAAGAPAPGSTTDLDRGLAAGAIVLVLALTYLTFRAHPARGPVASGPSASDPAG